jgi:hypothetical protein
MLVTLEAWQIYNYILKGTHIYGHTTLDTKIILYADALFTINKI